MTYIKLTRDNETTHNDMHWAVGVTNRSTGDGTELHSDDYYLHVYDTPEQAAFMCPAHGSDYTRAWLVESDDIGITDGTKRGIRECTVVREIELPKLTTEQRVEIAIRVALSVCDDPEYRRWFDDWMARDRSRDAAFAGVAAYAGTEFGAAYAAYVAEYSTIADSAARVAELAATCVANCAAVYGDSAYVTAYAYVAAADSAYVTAYAGRGGASIRQIDLLSIIEQVIRKERAE